MKVLVTGASGLMGRATARQLIARGDEVTVLQRRTAGLECREVLADLVDTDAVTAAAAGQDLVLHLAAKVDAFGPWPEYDRVNVQGTASVLTACRRNGVPRLVNVSSPSVAHSGDPLVGAAAGEADPATARSFYARSKATAELMALTANSADFAVLAIRPHLVWGPGDTQLIAPVVERARAGRLLLIGDGAALIDTTYLDNAVDALVAAVDACGRIRGEALVVSNGEPRPVAEILGRVCAAAGAPAPRFKVPFGVAAVAGSLAETAWRVGRLGGQPPITRFLAEQLGTAHWFDQRRARELLNWEPKVSLDQGFDRLHAAFAAS